MVQQRGSGTTKAWLIGLLALAYFISCFFLIFVYETYFRGLVVTSAGGTYEENDIMNGSIKRRTAASSTSLAVSGKQEITSSRRHGNNSERQRTRIHECNFQNQTVTLPEAPNLIVAGAMKSGTTYFWHLLREHPDFIQSKKFEAHFFDWKFAVPPSQIKLPQFWSRFDNATTEEDYLCAARRQYIQETFKVSTLLKEGEMRLSYEKTPNYMFLPQIPELISKICPWKPKIILILRNPVDRAYSHYIMDSEKENNAPPLSFEEYIQLELKTLREQGLSNVNPEIPISDWLSLNETSDHMFDISHLRQMSQEEADQANWMVYRQRHMRNYIHRGMYSTQLEGWMKYFPLNETLMVINNERLHREPRKVMGEVLKFVGARREKFFSNKAVPITFDLEKIEKRELSSKSMSNTLVRSMSSLLSIGGYEPMKPGTRHFLEKFFKPYNAELQHLLGDEWEGVWKYDE